jgi:ubiquinone biosynthesis protein
MARRNNLTRLTSDLLKAKRLRAFVRLLYIAWRIVRFALIAYGEAFLIRPPQRYSLLYSRLRRELEHLGVTFVKVGQYLAIREDLLPKELCSELSNLYFNLRPLPPDVVTNCIERELGRLAFASVDPKPIAAASIAQVHRAVSRDGRPLAIKILRPGTEEILRLDLGIIGRLAALADRVQLFANIQTVQLVREIAEFTLREIDFRAEAQAAERLAATPSPGIRIPKIMQDFTTSRLLTMEFIEGVTFLDIIRRAEAGAPDPFAELLPGVDPRRVAETSATAFFTQIFVTGFFHGDPHPANLIVEPNGAVALVDFGIVAELSPQLRNGFARYVEFVASGRVDRAASALMELVAPSPMTDILAYRKDTIAFMRQWYEASRRPGSLAKDRLQARYQGEMFKVMRKHNVRMPLNHVLFWKALASLDSTFHRMPVHYDLLVALSGFLARYRIQVLPRTFMDFGYEASRANIALPLALLDKAGGGEPTTRSALKTLRFQGQHHFDRFSAVLIALLTVSVVLFYFAAAHALRMMG